MGGRRRRRRLEGQAVKLLVLLLVVTLGVTIFVLGGADDSPGLQGIGAVLVAAAAALGIRSVLRRHRHKR